MLQAYKFGAEHALSRYIILERRNDADHWNIAEYKQKQNARQHHHMVHGTWAEPPSRFPIPLFHG